MAPSSEAHDMKNMVKSSTNNMACLPFASSGESTPVIHNPQHSSAVVDIRRLEKLRPIGRLESVSAACHHLDFFNNVGLSAHYKLWNPSSVLDLQDLVYDSVADVVHRHPVLCAIVVDEDTPDPYFARLPSVDLQRSVRFVTGNQSLAPGGQAEDKDLDALLQDEANTNLNSEYGTLPFWRLIILRSHGVENDFTACFIFHHAVGDGVSGLAFHSSFLDALHTASSSSSSHDSKSEHIVQSNGNPLLPSLEEIHPLPLPDMSNNTTSIPATLEEWTGGLIHQPLKPNFRSLSLSPSSLKAFIAECRKNQLTVTSAFPALVASILYSILPSDTEVLTCIIPVNLRPWLPHDIVAGAIGTWFDAFQVKLFRAEGSTEIWPEAHKVAQEIKRYLTNTSPSGQPYTTFAIFGSIPDISPIFTGTLGRPRDTAFELSNLGVFPNATAGGDAVWQLGKVTFSRSTVISGSALTIGAVTGGDGCLSLGFTLQEGVVEDAVVDKVIHATEKYFKTRGS
ncbi:hypothetical protein EJ02DRAFT_509756 [Clathrospora elynae]|uniref:Alcohol acetyltransferase n=1 Tax=Clathrospora elynae TaxID=706981 RepID=A0A6A5SWK6_9PLEO|nr:hypothetical protein EJ02DRAFT_509756 [Clathrospora elynae]